MSSLAGKRVMVTGGAGFLGRYVCQRLDDCEVIVPRSDEYDLTKKSDCRVCFEVFNPQVVIHLAAEVGGIGANMTNPGRFFYSNMAMGLNLIEESRISGVEKFIHVGTVCSYPCHAAVPFKEDDLWDGYPEPTNAPYGVAKKAIGVMLDAYHRQYGMAGAYVIPVNLYGPGDNFDPATSHVIPAMIRRFVEAVRRGAKNVTCWGTGSATREFLYVDDAARGIVAVAERLSEPIPVNLGSGREITMRDLASLIADACGYTGEITWDASRPDGQPRRLLDTSRAKSMLGWEARMDLETGIRKTVEWFRNSPLIATATVDRIMA